MNFESLLDREMIIFLYRDGDGLERINNIGS